MIHAVDLSSRALVILCVMEVGTSAVDKAIQKQYCSSHKRPLLSTCCMNLLLILVSNSLLMIMGLYWEVEDPLPVFLKTGQTLVPFYIPGKRFLLQAAVK